jgi:hypothetical protein
LLAQYDVYLALPNILPDMYEDMGIISKNIKKASDVMERLDRDLGLSQEELTPITTDEQNKLLRCVVAGQIDQLWMLDDRGDAVHIATKQRRELSSSTVVRSPKLMVGTPFDLQVPTHSGDLETLHLVQGITAVDTSWLTELASQLFTPRRGKMYYDPRTGNLATRQVVRFGKQVLEGNAEAVTENTPQNRRAFSEAFAVWAFEQLERERRNLGRYHTKRIPNISLKQLQQQVQSLASGAISLSELTAAKRKQLTDLSHLHAHFGNDFMAQVGTTYRPDKHEKRHRGWVPSHKRKFSRRER